MEQAIFITNVHNLRYAIKRYTRLYFGNEFCQNLIPSVDGLKEILSYVRRKDLDFSLVTPYVTNQGLRKVEKLLSLLKAMKVSCEVIVNDWGILKLINQSYQDLKPVLGRLLTKQKRGPRLLKLLRREVRPRLGIDPRDPKVRHIIIQRKLPSELDFYYKGSNTSSVPIIHEFLIQQRVKRIELDNLLQGIYLEMPQNGSITASIYTPFVYITTTRFCPTNGCEEGEKSPLKIRPCKRECQRYTFKLRHSTMPKVLYLKGNTQFYRNDNLPTKELKGKGIDRIVWQPEIPI